MSDMDPTYQWATSNRPKSNVAVDGQRHTSEKLLGRDGVKFQQRLRICSSQTDLSRPYKNDPVLVQISRSFMKSKT